MMLRSLPDSRRFTMPYLEFLKYKRLKLMVMPRCVPEQPSPPFHTNVVHRWLSPPPWRDMNRVKLITACHQLLDVSPRSPPRPDFNLSRYTGFGFPPQPQDSSSGHMAAQHCSQPSRTSLRIQPEHQVCVHRLSMVASGRGGRSRMGGKDSLRL